MAEKNLLLKYFRAQLIMSTVLLCLNAHTAYEAEDRDVSAAYDPATTALVADAATRVVATGADLVAQGARAAGPVLADVAHATYGAGKAVLRSGARAARGMDFASTGPGQKLVTMRNRINDSVSNAVNYVTSIFKVPTNDEFAQADPNSFHTKLRSFVSSAKARFNYGLKDIGKETPDVETTAATAKAAPAKAAPAAKAAVPDARTIAENNKLALIDALASGKTFTTAQQVRFADLTSTSDITTARVQINILLNKAAEKYQEDFKGRLGTAYDRDAIVAKFNDRMRLLAQNFTKATDRNFTITWNGTKFTVQADPELVKRTQDTDNYLDANVSPATTASTLTDSDRVGLQLAAEHPGLLTDQDFTVLQKLTKEARTKRFNLDQREKIAAQHKKLAQQKADAAKKLTDQETYLAKVLGTGKIWGFTGPTWWQSSKAETPDVAAAIQKAQTTPTQLTMADFDHLQQLWLDERNALFTSAQKDGIITQHKKLVQDKIASAPQDLTPKEVQTLSPQDLKNVTATSFDRLKPETQNALVVQALALVRKKVPASVATAAPAAKTSVATATARADGHAQNIGSLTNLDDTDIENMSPQGLALLHGKPGVDALDATKKKALAKKALDAV